MNRSQIKDCVLTHFSTTRRSSTTYPANRLSCLPTGSSTRIQLGPLRGCAAMRIRFLGGVLRHHSVLPSWPQRAQIRLRLLSGIGLHRTRTRHCESQRRGVIGPPDDGIGRLLSCLTGLVASPSSSPPITASWMLRQSELIELDDHLLAATLATALRRAPCRLLLRETGQD
jgi:hypothetical protein